MNGIFARDRWLAKIIWWNYCQQRITQNHWRMGAICKIFFSLNLKAVFDNSWVINPHGYLCHILLWITDQGNINCDLLIRSNCMVDEWHIFKVGEKIQLFLRNEPLPKQFLSVKANINWIFVPIVKSKLFSTRITCFRIPFEFLRK